MNKNMDECPEHKPDMSNKYLCIGHSQEHNECIDYKTNLETKYMFRRYGKPNTCKTRFFPTCMYKISFALTL
jgi:hypothetical protein